MLHYMLVFIHTPDMGHSMPNQHKKMSVSSDFNETWGTHTLPQVIILHPI